MKKKPISAYVMIAFFIAFIGYYAIFIAFTKDSVSTETEKRELNQMPELSFENYENISREFTAFLKDYIPFRQPVTQAYNNLMVNAFGVGDDSVVIGKEGWLFYNSNAKDPMTNELIDYTGSSMYTQTQMERVAAEVRAADEFCKQYGTQMIFLIAPNKSTTYADYMPDAYARVSEENRMDVLVDYLRANTEATILYPKEELMKAASKEKIYYSNDTHWNGLGAFYATELMTDVFELEYPKLDSIGLIEESSPEDLKYMLGVSEYEPDEGNTIPNYDALYQTSLINSWESMDSYQSTNQNGKKMLLLGDSFSEKLVPALSIAVEYLDASRSRYYRFVESGDYDYLVYEMVERNINVIAGEE